MKPTPCLAQGCQAAKTALPAAAVIVSGDRRIPMCLDHTLAAANMAMLLGLRIAIEPLPKPRADG
jgi:hypothetical protein